MQWSKSCRRSVCRLKGFTPNALTWFEGAPMTMKLVQQVTLITALFFLVVAVVFALVAPDTPHLSGVATDPENPSAALVRSISAVPHPVDVPRFVNCENCHAIGARLPMPNNHRTFTNATCSLCHAYPPASEPAEQAVAQEAAGQPPQTFGWASPIDERAMSAYELPDSCAVGKNLEQVITQEGCSLRADGIACVTCHNAERADGGVHLDDLQGKQELIDRGYVDRFISENSAKTDNLKRLFADWKARGYPD